MAEVYCRHGCDVCMLWLAAEEEEVGKEGRSADNLKRPLHNYDVTIFCTEFYVGWTEAVFGHFMAKMNPK